MFNELSIALPLPFIIKVFFALVLGCVIGHERQSKKKPAGIKTHAMICLGATILTHLSMTMSSTADPTRIAAQIVSGIGFIGAGTIFQAKHGVQGLTSAATVWVSAAIGMLLGGGFISLGIFSTALVVLLFYIYRPNPYHHSRNYLMVIEILDWTQIKAITNLMDRFDIELLHKSLEKKDKTVLHLQYAAPPLTHHFFSRKLCAMPDMGHIHIF
jgi:putative Mg2+ transporter-C (MgtC) family protein